MSETNLSSGEVADILTAAMASGTTDQFFDAVAAAEQDRYVTVTAQMRAAAILLRKFNQLYGFDPELKSWSPKELEHEATYLAKPIPEETL